MYVKSLKWTGMGVPPLVPLSLLIQALGGGLWLLVLISCAVQFVYFQPTSINIDAERHLLITRVSFMDSASHLPYYQSLCMYCHFTNGSH